ncbi:hypothetical protein RHGRI_000417 [Rhododendron griersonianum]|uniref:Uncharacterized protein n=1 Tax=Rhododendron griersonianum TaxID=479676 RepID=A0AAV6LHH7_9ERIC|nr:hypothetical protein RHGRI_000417 [Rhododendron griersonianum]
MGNRKSRPRCGMPPILPGPVDFLIGMAIKKLIEVNCRRIEQQNGNLYAMRLNCELPGRVTLKSFNNEDMSTEEAASKLLDGIPPEYADQLQIESGGASQALEH